MTLREKLIKDYTANIEAVEKALAASAAAGNADAVSVSISTAGASQSVTKSRDAWQGQIAYWSRKIARLRARNSFVLASVSHSFGGV